MPLPQPNVEEINRVQQLLAEEFPEPVAAPANVVNITNTIDLFGPSLLHFRGRTYEVPPVAFVDGLRLVDLQNRLGALEGKPIASDVLAEVQAVLESVRAMFPRMVRRRGWLSWLPVRAPRRMSEGEALTILGNWLGCRTKDLARSRAGLEATDRHP